MRLKTVLVSVVLYALLICLMINGVSTFNSESAVVEGPGEVKAIGIGVYMDKNCYHHVTSVDWGLIEPGSTIDINVFVRNEGNTSATLSISTSNWNPSEATSFVHLSWNYTGEIVEESRVLPVTLSLNVDADIEEIWVISFDVNIEGSQDSIKMVRTIAMTVSIRYPVWSLDVTPNSLNLRSKGRWITCYIEPPVNYDVTSINRTTIMLNETIPVDPFWMKKPVESLTGDYDNDSIPDLMVKLDRQAVIEYIRTKGTKDTEMTLTITGEADGSSFEVSDTIKVLHKQNN
jgi:hypothetical protein